MGIRQTADGTRKVRRAKAKARVGSSRSDVTAEKNDRGYKGGFRINLNKIEKLLGLYVAKHKKMIVTTIG